MLLGGNLFTGDLSALGDLSSLSLTVLSLAYLRAISESRIPLLNWRPLRFVNLQSSNITGTLPSELSEATLLGDLIVHSNAIFGTVPSLRDLVRLSRLDLAGNALTGLIEFPQPRDENLTALSCDVTQSSGCLCPSAANLFCECGCVSTGAIPTVITARTTRLAKTSEMVSTTATARTTRLTTAKTSEMVSTTTAKTSSIATSTSDALASETPLPLGAIIGGAIGGVCFVLAFAAAVLLWRRRSSQSTATASANANANDQYGPISITEQTQSEYGSGLSSLN